MKILIKSLLFTIVVISFAVISDKLPKSTDSMSGVKVESSSMSDQEFLEDVIAHHEGAVSMARIALENSDRAEIKKFASEVIIMETNNIAIAYRWRRDWFGDDDYIAIDKVDPKITMIKDLGRKDSNFDLRFLDAMIAHHEGAVKMLEGIIVPTSRTEIHNAALATIPALNKEIELMKTWKKEWYGK